MEIPNYAKRIEAARLAVGKEMDEMAELLGISYASYWDLEGYDDEVLTCLSLDKVKRLCEALKIHPVSLLSDRPNQAGPIAHVTLPDLMDRIKEHIAIHNLTVAEFEDRAGWGIQKCLDDPAQALGWNVDCLKDVCAEIGVDWLEALPG